MAVSGLAIVAMVLVVVFAIAILMQGKKGDS